MARVDDVAALVLEQCGTITTYKLHKLLYYAQGWSLAWSGRALFNEKIKAYEHGPVVSQLFNDHRGQRHVSRWSAGDSSRLSEDDRESVLAVIERYGSKSPEELVEMTHAERPWLDAWTGDRARANEISIESMRMFFSDQALRPVPMSREASAMSDRLRAFMSKSGGGS